MSGEIPTPESHSLSAEMEELRRQHQEERNSLEGLREQNRELREQLAQCQKEREKWERAAELRSKDYLQSKGDFEQMKEDRNRLFSDLTQARCEAEDHDRWLREMLADYKIEFDDHTVGRRLALNQFIHDLRAELEAANQAAVGMRTALKSNQSVLEWLAGAAGNDVIPPSADGTPAWHIIDGALTQIAITLSSPVGQGYARREELDAALARVAKPENFQQEQWEWVKATFPGETADGVLQHLKEEMVELEQSPRDPMEMADCFLLLQCLASHAGIDLMDAARQKFEECKTRQWTKTERGFRHSSTDAALPLPTQPDAPAIVL